MRLGFNSSLGRSRISLSISLVGARIPPACLPSRLRTVPNHVEPQLREPSPLLGSPPHVPLCHDIENVRIAIWRGRRPGQLGGGTGSGRWHFQLPPHRHNLRDTCHRRQLSEAAAPPLRHDHPAAPPEPSRQEAQVKHDFLPDRKRSRCSMCVVTGSY